MCSKKLTEILFSKGLSHSAYPLKLVHLNTDVPLIYPAQVMFVAPKRSFKHAHDRNKLKRRMREVYRLNKQELYSALQSSDKKKLLAFIYTARKLEDYAVIEKAMLRHIKALAAEGKGS